jgi:hypothetical protein
MEHAPEIFSKYRNPDQVPSVKDLHPEVEQLPMENDY